MSTSKAKQTENSFPPPSKDIFGNLPGIDRGIDAWWGLVIGTVALLILMIMIWPNPYYRIWEFVQDGLLMTVFTTATSFVLVLGLGLVAGLGRLSRNKLIYAIATIYVEVIRGIPLLVQLFTWYFAVPSIFQSLGNSLEAIPNLPDIFKSLSEMLLNYKADPVVTAISGLTFCYAAYMSEIYRAGIQSIPKGQMEAARSLGMSHFQAMRYIILPQAVRMILPPVGNEFISLLKDSSLISVMAVEDLTRRGREFMSKNFNPIETWMMIALLYLVMTLFSARVVSWIESLNKRER